MKKLPVSILMLSMIMSFGACNQQADNQDALDDVDLEDEAVAEDQNKAITLDSVSFSEFPNASLKMQSPKEGENLKSGNIEFSFNVQNFNLGEQTNNNTSYKLANSDKGQHIHFIDNNDPYSAHYEPKFNKELSEGNHVILAFLSRSFHGSVKNKDAYVLKTYTVGETNEEQDFDASAPHMFYSRPKGTYTGEDAKSIMLDFYLVNTDLSADGNRVRATINGREFMIDKWQPYVINNLPMGEVTIKLELIDKDKNLIDSPFNPVTRTITLESAEGDDSTM